MLIWLSNVYEETQTERYLANIIFNEFHVDLKVRIIAIFICVACLKIVKWEKIGGKKQMQRSPVVSKEIFIYKMFQYEWL